MDQPIDYSKYGIDIDAHRFGSIRGQAMDAELEAVNAEVAVLLESDPEDRAILEERATAARQLADERRVAAKVTKAEVKTYLDSRLTDAIRQLVVEHMSIAVQAESGDLAPKALERKAQIEQTIGLLEQRLNGSA